MKPINNIWHERAFRMDLVVAVEAGPPLLVLREAELVPLLSGIIFHDGFKSYDAVIWEGLYISDKRSIHRGNDPLRRNFKDAYLTEVLPMES